MKYTILLLFIFSLHAENILTINASQQHSKQTFLKQTHNHCYYKNSYIDPSNCYIQTGNIFLTLKNTKENYQNIETLYQLKFLRSVNPQKSLLLFKSLNKEIELINLVNTINQNNHTLKASVEWISPRRVR